MLSYNTLLYTTKMYRQKLAMQLNLYQMLSNFMLLKINLIPIFTVHHLYCKTNINNTVQEVQIT